MSGSSDVRYGRRGGRIIPARRDGAPYDDYGACELCGRPMLVGPAGGQHGAHVVCREADAARKRVGDGHTCHAEGCTAAVPPRLLMCARHWRMVPRAMQSALWAVYVPGQETRKDPTREYLAAARRCIDAVATAEGRRQ